MISLYETACPMYTPALSPGIRLTSEQLQNELCVVESSTGHMQGCTASENDSCIIVDNIKTLIDLRSDKEHTKDSEKYDTTVWDNYEDIIYTVKKGKRGRTKVLTPTSPRAMGSATW